ncbi:MAG: L-threonylcarbamoyladenylate synthase [Candidatus Heimdallarchaeota archaeon]
MGPKELSLLDDDLFEQMKNCAEHNGLIVYPTDTFYGLGADARDSRAVQRVFEVKERAPNKPLSVVVSRDTLPLFAKLGEQSIDIIDNFLPGPLTVIFNQKGNLSNKLNLNDPRRIGFRILHPQYRISEFVDLFGIPLTATSANLSGAAGETLHEIVENMQLKEWDIIVRADLQMSFLPSTVLDLTVKPPKILREGILSQRLRKKGCI